VYSSVLQTIKLLLYTDLLYYTQNGLFQYNVVRTHQKQTWMTRGTKCWVVFLCSYKLKHSTLYYLVAMDSIRTFAAKSKHELVFMHFLSDWENKKTQHSDCVRVWGRVLLKHVLPNEATVFFVRTWNIFVRTRRLPSGRAMSACELYNPPRFGTKGCVRGFGCQDSMPEGSHCTSRTHLQAKSISKITEWSQSEASMSDNYCAS
jgi:hypothetical protein